MLSLIHFPVEIRNQSTNAKITAFMKGNCITTVHQLAQKHFSYLWGKKDVSFHSDFQYSLLLAKQSKKLPQRKKIYEISYIQFRNTAELLAVFQVYGTHYIIQTPFHLPKRVTEASALVSLLRFVNFSSNSSKASSLQSQHS